MDRWMALVVLALLLGGVGPPVAARDQGNLGTMSPENRTLERDFTPMVGQFPQRTGSDVPFALFRPPACRTVTYCDAFEVDITYPDDYVRDVFFGVSFTLSWENPRTEDDPAGNDLDLFLWPDDGQATGGPSSDCRNPRTEECDELETEVITLTEPSDTGPDDDHIDPLFFTVVNDEGVNSGYTISARWFTFDLDFGEFSEFEVPARQDTTDAGQTEAASESSVLGPSRVPGGASQYSPDDPRLVLVPGPDGDLVEIALPVLVAGDGLEPVRRGVWTSTTWAVIGAILCGTAVAVLVLRRRRNMHFDADRPEIGA